MRALIALTDGQRHELAQRSDALPTTASVQLWQRASPGYDPRVVFPRLTVPEPMTVGKHSHTDDHASPA